MGKKSTNVEMIHISKNLSFAHLKLLFHAWVYKHGYEVKHFILL